MKATAAEIEKHLKRLEETPRWIDGVTENVDPGRLHQRPTQKSWSVHDILAHLRSCADVWGSTIDAMLAQDHPTLPDVHPRRWIQTTDYLELPFPESFQAFVRQRRKLLIMLKNLSFDDWSRVAIIGGRRHTVFTQARRMAKHEKEHCEQMESLLERASQR
jgi:hypothetical protein